MNAYIVFIVYFNSILIYSILLIYPIWLQWPSTGGADPAWMTSGWNLTMTTSRHVTWTPWTPDGPWLKSWDPAWETYEKRWEITIFHRKTMGKPWEKWWFIWKDPPFLMISKSTQFPLGHGFYFSLKLCVKLQEATSGTAGSGSAKHALQ